MRSHEGRSIAPFARMRLRQFHREISPYAWVILETQLLCLIGYAAIRPLCHRRKSWGQFASESNDLGSGCDQLTRETVERLWIKNWPFQQRVAGAQRARVSL